MLSEQLLRSLSTDRLDHHIGTSLYPLKWCNFLLWMHSAQVPSLNSRAKGHFHIEPCMEMVSIQTSSDTRIWGNWKCSLYSRCIFLKNSLLLGTLVRIPTNECIGGYSNLVSFAVAKTDCSRQSWSVLATRRIQKTQVLQEFPLDPAGDQLRLSHVCAKSEAGGKFYSPITNPWNMGFQWKCWHSHDSSDTNTPAVKYVCCLVRCHSLQKEKRYL